MICWSLRKIVGQQILIRIKLKILKGNSLHSKVIRSISKPIVDTGASLSRTGSCKAPVYVFQRVHLFVYVHRWSLSPDGSVRRTAARRERKGETQSRSQGTRRAVPRPEAARHLGQPYIGEYSRTEKASLYLKPFSLLLIKSHSGTTAVRDSKCSIRQGQKLANNVPRETGVII